MAKIREEQQRGGVAVVGGAGSNPVFPGRKIKNPYNCFNCLARSVSFFHRYKYCDGCGAKAYQEGWDAGYEQAREDFEQ